MLTSGCASYARRLEVGTVKKVQAGVTHRAEVEKLLGPPSETITGSNGKSVARYFFRELHKSGDVSLYERKEHPGDILFRTLSLRYGSSGSSPVVEQRLHDESVTAIRRFNHLYTAGPTLTPEALVPLRKNVSTAAEMIELMGEPTSRTFDEEGREILIWLSLQAVRERFGDVEVRQLVAFMGEHHVLKDYVVIMHDSRAFTDAGVEGHSRSGVTTRSRKAGVAERLGDGSRGFQATVQRSGDIPSRSDG